MTSGNDGADGDGGGVRHAAESLRATLDALPDLAEHLDAAVRKRIDTTTGAVEHAAQGTGDAVRQDLLATAHQIRLIGTRMTATREDTLTHVAHVLTQHADEIDALLRPTSGDGAPVISVPPPPMPAPSVQTTAQDAAAVQQQLPDKAAQRRAINQVIAQFPPHLQNLARTLLLGHSSHAVERHEISENFRQWREVFSDGGGELVEYYVEACDAVPGWLESNFNDLRGFRDELAAHLRDSSVGPFPSETQWTTDEYLRDLWFDVFGAGAPPDDPFPVPRERWGRHRMTTYLRDIPYRYPERVRPESLAWLEVRA